MRNIPLLRTACLLSVSTMAIFAAETAAPLWKNDYRAARAEARELDQPLLLHFYGVKCGPCQAMEREVFTSSEFRRTIEGAIVAVKIDVHRHPDVAEQFGVSQIPADVIIGTDGKVLMRREGFFAGDGRKYIASIAKHRAPAPAKALPQGEVPIKVATGDTGNRSRKSATPTSVSETDRVVNPVGTPADIETAVERHDPAVIGSERPPAAGTAGTNVPSLPGLDGYCPVTLRETGSWVEGDEAYGHEYQGQRYLLKSRQALEEFQAHPERYAPQGAGLDLVAFDEARRTVRGSTKFGAYYNGELYLFRDRESRTRFKQNPARYARLREGANLTQIDRLASVSDNDTGL